MDFQNLTMKAIKPVARIFLSGLLIFNGLPSPAQTLSLPQCYQAADHLSPLSRKKLYHQSIATLREKIASAKNLPIIDLNGQFSYQSDVFSFPFEDPSMETPTIPKEQYRISIGLNQKIFDGGSVKRTKAIVDTETAADQQQVAVELYQVREIINELFFGALVNQENAAIMEAQLATLKDQLTEIDSKVRNGVLLATNADILKKEILIVEQNLIQIRLDIMGYKNMLSSWTGRDIDDATTLLVPDLSHYNSHSHQIMRPELRLYDLKLQHVQAQQELAAVKNYPRVSAFINAGLSRPNPYDIFKTDLSGFYITGLSLSWKLFDWNQNKHDIQVLDFRKDILTSERDDFEHRLTIDLIQSDTEIQKLEALLEKDREILELQEGIVKASYAQLQNGVISSTDYITELNKETTDKLTVNLRGLLLLRTKIDKLTKSGIYERAI